MKSPTNKKKKTVDIGANISTRKKPSKKREKKWGDFSRIERALLILAGHAERCPYCYYKVSQEILDELGYIKLPTHE